MWQCIHKEVVIKHKLNSLNKLSKSSHLIIQCVWIILYINVHIASQRSTKRYIISQCTYNNYIYMHLHELSIDYTLVNVDILKYV